MCSIFNEGKTVSQGVKLMMRKVCGDLQVFLEELQRIYTSYGINYKVKQYYNVLIRIIAPFQLLSHYHIIDNLPLFTKDEQQHTQSSKKAEVQSTPVPAPLLISKRDSQVKLNQVAYPFSSSQPGSSQIIFANQQNSIRKQNKRKMGEYHQKQEEIEQKRWNTNQHRIDAQMEQIVYEWTKRQIQFDKMVQMIDICRYAKAVSKNKLFLASSGWCKNFINRHPDIIPFVKRRNRRQFQQQKYTESEQIKNQKTSRTRANMKSAQREFLRPYKLNKKSTKFGLQNASKFHYPKQDSSSQDSGQIQQQNCSQIGQAWSQNGKAQLMDVYDQSEEQASKSN